MDKQELKELAELHAQVIASKMARAEYREFVQSGPGRIYSLELNLERIYEI